MKELFRKFYDFGLSSESEFLTRQKVIRTKEWDSIVHLIPEGSSFLDIGCGKGHSMSLAINQKNCNCTGIDPFPNFAGATPELAGVEHKFSIVEGWAENLPFEDNSFDVVYSSHMLEHTSDYDKALSEMNRVVRPDGIVIMGVPTATMATIRLVSVALLSTHRNIIELARWMFRTKDWQKAHPISMFIIPSSHGQPNRTIFYDLWDYQVNRWKSRLEKQLRFDQLTQPALYCYPDFISLFKLSVIKNWSSSAFFIARKKTDGQIT
ncbi:MAG: class I SAM-dependent methyltransferase [Flavobacteriales bacterium]|nr:class I SAM-dependent methyltransferase [Flavobacteriales bacterium]